MPAPIKQDEPFRYVKQRVDFWNSGARLQIVTAGRSAGKSVLALEKFAKRTTLPHPLCKRPFYAYCLPTLGQAKRNVWQRLKDIYARSGFLACKPNESEMKISLVNGATVYIAGLESAKRIEGQHYCGIAIDEMSDVPPNAVILSVLPALNTFKGWLILLGVPKRFGVGAKYYQDLIREVQEGGAVAEKFGSCAYFHWTSEDVYTKEEMAIYRTMMSDKDYREQFLATWETAGGAVYYAYTEKDNVVEHIPIREDLPLIIGCDFNVSPMSWVICQAEINNNGQLKGTLNVVGEQRLYNTNTPEALDCLWSNWGGHQAGYVFYGDAAGYHRNTVTALSDYIIIEQDERYWQPWDDATDIRVPRCNPAVLDRVGSVNAMLKNRSGNVRIKIDSSCRALIEDMERVSYVNGTRFMDKSNSDLTHMSDALGYVVHSIAPIGFENIGETSIPQTT